MGFKIAEKSSVFFFCIFKTPFSVDINILPANFEMECIELQSDTQLKKIDLSLPLDF